MLQEMVDFLVDVWEQEGLYDNFWINSVSIPWDFWKDALKNSCIIVMVETHQCLHSMLRHINLVLTIICIVSLSRVSSILCHTLLFEGVPKNLTDDCLHGQDNKKMSGYIFEKLSFSKKYYSIDNSKFFKFLLHSKMSKLLSCTFSTYGMES
jgi:hypothetical protein